MTPATNSLDGGLDYAYGDAETLDGYPHRIPARRPECRQIENMGQQVTQFITEANAVADSNALYIVWGGANDLFADYTDANVQATASRVSALVNRLAVRRRAELSSCPISRPSVTRRSTTPTRRSRRT